ncbi:hypothetical protein AB0N88_36360 [Streptomyces sp. NPDC093516]|uniref:hypothetical protein n=1 Tax=Streptomyces sp. NPDC093516 TaxID=3155304 RepID=UPI0034448145
MRPYLRPGLLAGSAAAQNYDTTQGGGVRSVSISSSLTGFPVNLLVADDPHKDRGEAESPRLREQVHEWWSSAALKRLQPDRNAVVAMHTRWHPDVFCGRRLEEGGRWQVVHLHAMAQGDPQPTEGALVPRDLLRLILDGVIAVEPPEDRRGGRPLQWWP